ncbi:MAG: Bug family tripartite tricarboxylate transporter substrate binding protein [Betaproteobacteria bacterium]
MILRVLAALAFVLCGTALGQDYPAKPVRLLVGFPPGGAMDLVARLLQPGLAQRLGREIIVDNRPGAGGVLAADLAARAAPDGYTIALINHAALVISPAMTRVPYDPLVDFTAIARVVELQNIFLVKPGFPAGTLRELVAVSKAKPGAFSYATPGAGSAGHLSGELLKGLAGIDWVHVPYRGGAPAMTDFLGGQVELFVAVVSTAVPYLKQGKVRALAVSGSRRAAALPDVPTVAESGWPGYESTSWYALMGPARLPQAVVARLHKETAAVLAEPEVRKSLLDRGLEAWPSSPQELAEFIRIEKARSGPLVKAAGLQPN